ncbi:putative gustatory receptor 28b [Zophobas morio]|uniref:putative gustatory receptor 28b n=1 Tax=Zophobas morio TaxID=2755281 RepID=UPI003083B0C6
MTKQNIYESVSVSIYIALFLGIFPTYFSKIGKRVILATNKWCSAIIFTYFVLFTTMVYMSTLAFNPITDGTLYNFNTLAKLLTLVVTLVGDLGTWALLIQGYFHKHHVKNFFNTVATIDKTFTKIGHKINHNFYTYLAINLSGPALTVSNVVMQLWNMKRGKEKMDRLPPILLFCHFYSFSLVHHGETLFVTCNVVLSKRFEAIGLILKKLGERNLIKNSKPDDKVLDICIACHDKLCDLHDVVNKVFGFLVIVGSLIQFNTVVFAFCYCYYSISIRPISTLGWFFWAVFRIYELTRKAISAHITTSEAQTILHLVGKLMIHADTHTEEKLKMFALQIKHRTRPLTALGLFPIDGTFAFTIIGATTTYITIIYQFQVNKLAC